MTTLFWLCVTVLPAIVTFFAVAPYHLRRRDRYLVPGFDALAITVLTAALWPIGLPWTIMTNVFDDTRRPRAVIKAEKKRQVAEHQLAEARALAARERELGI